MLESGFASSDQTTTLADRMHCESGGSVIEPLLPRAAHRRMASR